MIKKVTPIVVLLIMTLLLLPTVALSKSSQNSNISNDATKTQIKLIKEVAKIRENAKSESDLQKSLEKLGLKADRTIVTRIKLENEDGQQVPVVVDEKIYPGYYTPTGEVSPMAGEKSDLTLSCVVNRGYDELYGDAWISLDYKFNWSSTEWINGSDDGWAVNWDRTEAYAVYSDCDSDMDLVKDEIGGMGITTDDDNKVGKAWVMLTPRSGYTPWTAHGELTQTYLHTWGLNSPIVTITANAGVVSVGVSGGTTEGNWSKTLRSTY